MLGLLPLKKDRHPTTAQRRDNYLHQLEPVQYVCRWGLRSRDQPCSCSRAEFPSNYKSLQRPLPFPYVPGFLSFREIPAVLDALEKINTIPDLILCDGQGIAHPRRFGIACHLGLIVDIPNPVAKSLLIVSMRKYQSSGQLATAYK